MHVQCLTRPQLAFGFGARTNLFVIGHAKGQPKRGVTLSAGANVHCDDPAKPSKTVLKRPENFLTRYWKRT